MVRRGILTCFLAALGLLACGHMAAAQAVPPVGTVVSETNVSTVSDLVSPVVAWCVKHGMQLTIGPYKRIDMPTAYIQATEKYAGQVKLTAQGTVEGYAAGLPFPTIDPNDPNAGLKLAWRMGPMISSRVYYRACAGSGGESRPRVQNAPRYAAQGKGRYSGLEILSQALRPPAPKQAVGTN